MQQDKRRQPQQFRDPWGAPPLNSGVPRSTSPSQIAPLLAQSHRRGSTFNPALPTTYEFGARRPSMIPPQPPTRAHNPEPFSMDVADHNSTQRRQSVAVAGYKLPPVVPAQQRKQSTTSVLNTYPQVQRIPAPIVTKITSRRDLKPRLNPQPKYRRASAQSHAVSPLASLTVALTTTFSLCRPEFNYQTSRNPRRVLTKPSEGKYNNGYDNEHSDYILYVNDVLGVENSRKFLVLDILGQGTFGQVVKCQNLHTREIVAVKVVKSKTAYLNQSLSEVNILELLNKKIDPHNQHHFLQLKDKFLHKNHLCLVFELLSNNLFELLKQNQFHGISLKLVRTFAQQLLDSLCVLKDSKLIHCDLKPENILLVTPDKPDIKVVDFGSACEEHRTLFTYIQSRFYRAPEVILGIPYTCSIDMWSFGCVLAELFLGLPIFPSTSEYNQITRITTMLGTPPQWMMDMGKNTKNFFVDGQLKTLDAYSREFNVEEKPSKMYFPTNDLDEIIKTYAAKKVTTVDMQDRVCFIHFLRGVLNMNPLERWTPQQASLHPFIQGARFTGEWFPPGGRSIGKH